MNCNQEDHGNRNKPVRGKRSIENIEKEADDCEGIRMKIMRN